MMRLFILGIITLFGLIVTVLSIISMVFIVKWLKRLYLSGSRYVDQQYRQWKTRQAEKDIPDFLMQASKRMKNIEGLAKQLAPKWGLLIDPLIIESRELVDRGLVNPEQGELTRTFYTVTLKAIESFIQTMVPVQENIRESEEDKARDNIELLMNDIYKYRAKQESKKRFDFHVMMEVIKQRLGK